MTTEAAPAAAAAAAPAASAATPAATAAPWHGYTTPEDVAYVTNKAWQGPQDAIKSYREAEKLIGRDPNTLLVMPRADDPAGLRAVYGKLGLPEAPEKYEFAKPGDGLALDPGYEKFARATFHKIGMPASMAKELTAEHNAYVAELNKQAAKDYDLSVATDKAALLKEWGGGHDRMLNSAKTAAKALGFTPEVIDGIERTVGYAGTWKFMAALGQKLGEPGLVTGGDKNGDFNNATLTPAEAKTQWETLKNDPNWKAAAGDAQHPGHQEAKRKQTALFAVMYPNG